MSLSVSYNQNISGIETAAIENVANQILQRANSQNSALSNLDLTKFNRPTLGTDLYSGKVDASTARQISMTNSGMQVNLSASALASLSFLNAQASKALLQSVDGKISVAEPKEVSDKANASVLPSFGRLTETADLGSDKRGSNPFYKGELLNVTDKKENDEVLNIFA